MNDRRPSARGAFSSGLPAAPLNVAVVGAGRVGCSIARALASRGHRIAGVAVRREESVARVREVLGPVRVGRASDVVPPATVVVIAVPDDHISEVVSELLRMRARSDATTAAVIHTSGLYGADVLRPCGPNVAAIHPAQTIPEPTTSLDGAFFGVTAPHHMRDWATWFVSEVGGRTIAVAEQDRTLYHAALSMASNFTVALAGDAADLLGSTEALGPLLEQTVANVARLGADAALTGPVMRGDAGTVRAHIAALTTRAPHLLESYVANARRVLARAVDAGRLDEAGAAAVAGALEEAMVR